MRTIFFLESLFLGAPARLAWSLFLGAPARLAWSLFLGAPARLAWSLFLGAPARLAWSLFLGAPARLAWSLFLGAPARLAWSLFLGAPARLAWSLALVSVAVISGTVAAASDPCGSGKTIELDRAGMPLANVPVMAQEGGGCWAMGALGLVEAWRHSHSPQPPIGGENFLASPYELIGEICKTRDCSAGGQVGWAIDYLRSHHLACNHFALTGGKAASLGTDVERSALSWRHSQALKKIIRQHDAMWALTRTPNGKQEIRALYEEALAAHPAWNSSQIGLEGMYLFAKRYGPTEKYSFAEEMCLGLDLGAFVLPSSTYGPVDMLAVFLAQQSATDFVDRLKSQICKQNSADYGSFLPPLKTVATKNDGDVRELLNRALDAPNPQPIEINICAAVFDHKRPYRGRRSIRSGCEEASVFDKKKGHDDHGVLVVGRRHNPQSGRCEFLVRNSWSESCTSYENSPAHWDCRNGQIWIDAEDLSANTSELSWLTGAF